MATKTTIPVIALLLLSLFAGGAASAQDGGTLEVSVRYTGTEGAVNEERPIIVAMFDNPPAGESARPVGFPQLVQENGVTVTFEDLTTSPVYVVAFFGNPASGQPVSGGPLGIYGDSWEEPDGIDITDGDTIEVELRFDDTLRMP